MLNRFVIPTIEGRIFTGITMFVAVMILIGWVAINEPARMASFSEQHTGRSIERGAELFASRCSTCHGADGLGIAEKAPALNNPMLFNANFLKDLNDKILPLERRISELDEQLKKLEEERAALTTEAGNADLTDARRQEINTRLAEIDVLTGVEGETAISPQIAVLQAELAPLYVDRDKALIGLEDAIGKGYLPELATYQNEKTPLELTNYLNQDANRLAQVGWGGSVEQYIKTTLIHGRPGSEKVWPDPMVSWSQLGGGPLRDDQIDDIVAFVVNYNKGDAWSLEDLNKVNQFAKLHGGAPEGTGIPAVGTDVAVAFAAVEPLVGDPARGDALYHGNEKTEIGARLGCSGCHVGAVTAPDTEGTWDRVTTDRLPLAQFAGYTEEHYIVESIIHPDAFIVPTYGGEMPDDLGEKVSAKDLADLVAFLNSTSPSYVQPDPSTITPRTQPNAAPAAPVAESTTEAMGGVEATAEAPAIELTAESEPTTPQATVEPSGEIPAVPTAEATAAS